MMAVVLMVLSSPDLTGGTLSFPRGLVQPRLALALAALPADVQGAVGT